MPWPSFFGRWTILAHRPLVLGPNSLLPPRLCYPNHAMPCKHYDAEQRIPPNPNPDDRSHGLTPPALLAALTHFHFLPLVRPWWPLLWPPTAAWMAASMNLLGEAARVQGWLTPSKPPFSPTVVYLPSSVVRMSEVP
jgi:hypothetical protein